MKTLQKDTTTPEQSKRLLELGVPADSADCYYDKCAEVYDRYNICEDGYFDEHYQSFEQLIPCWSVGRLIEIFLLCSPYKSIEINKSDKVEQMIVSMENEHILLDFSKLED